MTLWTWAATALSAAMIALIGALPEARTSATPTTRTAVDDGALLLRVEREVVEPLREREVGRWRFSRVHRPTPAYRVAADRGLSDGRHAAFRISVKEPFGEAERAVCLVRVDRRGGAIEFAYPSAPDAHGRHDWQPLARLLAPAGAPDAVD